MADRKGSALDTAPSLTDLFVYGWVGDVPYKVPATMLGGGVDASDIAFTPAGSIAATTVQAAIEEVANEAGTSVPFTAASSSGPASLAFAEDTDNGTNKTTLQSAAALGADNVVTLPSVTGTVPTGPTSTTDNTLPRFDGTAGALQSSALIVDDNADASGLRNIELASTDAGAAEGPLVSLYRNSASPAAADAMGELQFNGKDSGGNKTLYALLRAILDDATNGSEDASLSFRALVAGSMVDHLSVGGGIVSLLRGQLKFPSTAVPSSDTTTLDDYREVSFTPGLSFNNGSTGMTYTTQTGLAIKIGRLVIGAYVVTLSAKGSSTGDARVTGLPFTVGASSWSGFGGYMANMASLTSIPFSIADNGGTLASLYHSGATGVSRLTHSNFNNNSQIEGVAVYYANS